MTDMTTLPDRLLGLIALFGASLLLAGQAAGDASPSGSIGGFEAKFVDVDGVRARYYDEGSGEPLILVHGSLWRGTANANTWVPNIGGLSEHFRVIALDRLGSGMTGNPLSDDDYNMRGEVRFIRAFLDTLDLGPVHLMGQSTGGAVVYFTAVEHPELIRTLLIVNSGPAAPRVGPTGRQAALARCNTGDWKKDWVCTYEALSYDASHMTDEFIEASLYMQSQPKVAETQAKLKAGAGEPWRSRHDEWKKSVHERVKKEGTLQMPVLLYWSRNDPNSPVGFPGAQEASVLFDVIGAKNPRVRQILLNHGGHFFYREHPEEFNHNVVSFIQHWQEKGY